MLDIKMSEEALLLRFIEAKQILSKFHFQSSGNDKYQLIIAIAQ